MLPAAVQVKEVLNAVTAGTRGERRRSITRMPFFREIEQGGQKVTDTTYLQEAGRVLGFEDIDQARERELVQKAAREGAQDKELKAHQANLAFARLRRGDTDGFFEIIEDAGVTVDQLRARARTSDQSQLLRVLLGSMGPELRADFVERHPEVLDMVGGGEGR